MRAAVLSSPAPVSQGPLRIADVPRPPLTPGHIVLRVRACGVCRTDLHIVEGELSPRRDAVIPGHQIVGEVVEAATQMWPIGARVGVSWIGGVDGTCWYCTHGAENLCDAPTFTGYSVDGGYAEYTLVPADYAYRLPDGYDDTELAPLLCAGIIGYRALRRTGLRPGGRLGVYGFGGSAHLAAQVALAEGATVHV